MILVTVGGQMPFDRLIKAVDEWHVEANPTEEIFFQIAESNYVPKSGRWTKFFAVDEFNECLESATAVVAHAGMGSILTALQARKPILVMPRLGALEETRNDHQVATARRLREFSGIHVAMNETELATKLSCIGSLRAGESISPWASERLQAAIREFIHAA